MGWSYFTTLLAEGDLITADQRNELYDAFLERAAAVGPWHAGFAASIGLRTSGFSTDLIELIGGGSQRLLGAISTISAYYVREEVIDDAMTLGVTDSWGFFGDVEDATSLWYRACAAAGVSAAEFTAIQTDETLDSYQRWNIIREAIRLLKYPLLAEGSPTEKIQTAESPDDWASAAADFLTSETTGSAGFPYEIALHAIYSAGAASPYQIGANRKFIPVTIPATAAFTAGYTLAAFLSRGTFDDVGDSVRVNFYGSTDVTGFPDETDRKACLISASGKTATGDLDVDVAMLGYHDSAALDLYETSAGDDEHWGGANLTGFTALPTFSYT